MARLLRDRYYEYTPEHAWDLATGDALRVDEIAERRSASDPALAAFVEVLDHGREGAPRWLVVDIETARTVAPAVDAAAEESRARGFVPIDVALYLRLRSVLREDLCGRALVLIARPVIPLEAARAALVDACGHSPRPHVLLTFRSPDASPAIAKRREQPFLVREARAVYGAQAVSRTSPAPLPSDVVQHVLRGSRAAEFIAEGRHAAAERLLRDVAAALLRRRAFAQACDSYIVLGRLLLERGRARDAEEIFNDAATHAVTAGDEALTNAARIWQAASRTDAGHLTAAESLCRGVLLTGTGDAAQRAWAEATLARVLLWQGRVEEAAALAFAGPTCPPDSMPFVHATAVRVLVERGYFFEAGERARGLLTATAGDDLVSQLIAMVAQLRVVLAMGDCGLADECVARIAAAARRARSPLRLARVRLMYVDALRRAGRRRDAEDQLEHLRRLRHVAPLLLREQIDRRVKGDAPSERRQSPSAAVPASAIALVTLVQHEENDHDAVAKLLDFMNGVLQTSRADLWSCDAGPATVLVTSGSGLRTQLGGRVLEAGIPIGPEPNDPAHELAVPVRLGTKLLAALAVRWPVDRRPPETGVELLNLAAAVAAPRVDALLAAGREQASAATAIPELVGVSSAMADVRRSIARAAAAPFAVLVEGESGVGKELVARAIHQLSPRRERRFCDVNCAALPDDLLESELFGHARGAFTGAVAERAGMFEDADGGTLFLDEVIDLSPRAQAKLLRVVQQQEVRRVGESFSRKVDVRLVSAANRDLRAEAAAGRFRQDLLYRLEVIAIRIPPLRERPEDITLLAEHFWRAAASRVGTQARLAPATLAALARYHWPGNVRELQNVMAALAVEAPARGMVRPSMLPRVISGAAAITAGRLADARTQFDRRFLELALARAGGSRSRAARELGISRQGLLKLLARLGLQP